MKKRVLSIFLAVCMCLSLLPVSALAEEEGATPVAQVATNNITTDYDTLDEAWTAAQVGTTNTPATLKLLAGVTATSTLDVGGSCVMTLDLNGQTLDLGANQIINGNELIITDTATDTVGTITSSNTVGTIKNNMMSYLYIYDGQIANTDCDVIYNNMGHIYLSGSPIFMPKEGYAAIFRADSSSTIYPYRAPGETTTRFTGNASIRFPDGNYLNGQDVVVGINSNEATHFSCVNANYELEYVSSALKFKGVDVAPKYYDSDGTALSGDGYPATVEYGTQLTELTAAPSTGGTFLGWLVSNDGGSTWGTQPKTASKIQVTSTNFALKAAYETAAAHTHPVCGTSCTCGGGHETLTDWKELTWDATKSTILVDGADLRKETNPSGYTGTCYYLTGGHYYLGQEITLDSGIYVPKNENVTLCLNGQTLYASGERNQVMGTLNITDCQETAGKIAGISNATRPLLFVNQGTLNLYQGKLCDNDSNNSDGGGAVEVNGSSDGTSGTFNMYGGTISGNKAYRGGGVSIHNKGAFKMYGGTITGNSTTDGNGGGVYMDGTTFEMSGGSITGNKTAKAGGGVYISSDSTVTVSGGANITENTGADETTASNLCINRYAKKITVGTLTAGAKFGVSVNPDLAAGSFVTIADANDGKNAAYFSADDSTNYELKNENGELKLYRKAVANVTGVTVAPATAEVQKGGTQQFNAEVTGTNSPAQTVTWSVTGGVTGTVISADGLLTVAADETAASLTVTAISTVDDTKSGTSTVTVTALAGTHTHDGKTFTAWDGTGDLADGNSYYLTDNVTCSSNKTIPAGEPVNLCLNGYTISFGSNHIEIASGATLNLYDDCQSTGKVTGGGSTGSSGVVYVKMGGAFNLYGGTLEATSSDCYVIRNEGTTHIYDGTLTTANGYAINNKRDTLYIGDLYVHGGALNGGGGYAVVNSGQFHLSGGSLNSTIADVMFGGDPIVANDGDTESPTYYNGETVTIFLDDRWPLPGSDVVTGLLPDITDGDATDLFEATGGKPLTLDGTTLKLAAPTTYTVTYNGNGHTGGAVPTDSNSYASGASVTVLDAENLVKTGYTFSGWNTNADGTGTNHEAGKSFNISANTILYAQWAENNLSVTTAEGEINYYATLKDAFEAAPDKSTIKVEKNYTEIVSAQFFDENAPMRTVTLDLNGMTIDTKGDEDEVFIYVGNDLTIKGDGAYTGPIIHMGGKLTIENGTFGGLVVQNGADLAPGLSTPDTELKGGTFQGSNYVVDNIAMGVCYADVTENEAKAGLAGLLADGMAYSPADVETTTIAGETVHVAYIADEVRIVSVATYTVTYTDGVESETVFADQVTENLVSGVNTPAFEGTPSRPGYNFAGWVPEVAATVTEDAIYTAQWTAIPTPPSGGGGSSVTTYPPVVEETENGTVTVKPGRPERGDKVTITLIPDEGFAPGGLTVTDKDGKPVAVTDNGDGTYTFTQPRGKVTIAAAFVLKSCSGGENCPSRAFSDLDTGAWYHEGTDYVIEHGLMSGYGNGKFAPDDPLSRGMVVTILWRLEGSPMINYLMDYDDVPQDAYYTEAIRWATGVGVAVGYGNGCFGPGDEITREQLATILYRYATYKGMTSVTLEDNLVGFSDHEKTSGFAVQAMNWAVGQGLIAGIGNNTLNPTGTATRAQAAMILTRYCENILK